MKKNIVRIVALLLVAMLALTLLPLGAFAIEPDLVYVQKEYFDEKEPSMEDYMNTYNPWGDPDEYKPGSKIKVSDYDDAIVIDGKLYDFAGFENNEKIDKYYDKTASYTPEEFAKWAEDTDLPLINSNISVPKDLTSEKGQDWLSLWQYIYAAYVPHSHKLSHWYSDGTTHWRECLVCKNYAGFEEPFIYQNWCQDGDEDGICNVCGGDVPYHDVTVIESEGGKITVNRDTASHRMKITADVEPAAGYSLKKLHFVKVRPDGSRQEVTRKKLNGQFWTLMPTYDLEVSAEFVKN